MKQTNIKWLIIFLIFFTVCSQIGFYIGGNIAGIYNLENIAATLVGSSIASIILVVITINHNKKNIPEFDERSIALMKNVSHYIAHAFLLISCVIILVLSLIGVHTIDIQAIAAYLSIIYLSIGVGILVIKNI